MNRGTALALKGTCCTLSGQQAFLMKVEIMGVVETSCIVQPGRYRLLFGEWHKLGKIYRSLGGQIIIRLLK